MYVAVKGGEQAIANAHRWMADRRRGDRHQPELQTEQIRDQLGLCLLYTSPSPRDKRQSRMPSSA